MTAFAAIRRSHEDLHLLSPNSALKVRINRKWLFTKRKIYNDGRDEWEYKGGKNPLVAR